jgi:hypothetical protein
MGQPAGEMAWRISVGATGDPAMNSIHRLGLTIAGVVAALVVAGALVVQGYASAQSAAAQASAAQQAATAASTPMATLAPETIYVNPAPTPGTVTITRTAQPIVQSGSGATTPAIQIVVPGSGRGDDGGGGDD